MSPAEPHENPGGPWPPNAWTRVWIGGHQTDAKRILLKVLNHTENPPTGPLDAACIAPAAADEAAYFARKVVPRIADRRVWVAITPADRDVSRQDMNAAMQAAGFAPESELSLQAPGGATPSNTPVLMEGQAGTVLLLGFRFVESDG